jgi:hypothetical protein
VLWTIRIEQGAAVIDTASATGLALAPTSKDEVVNSASGIQLTLLRGPRGIRGFTATIKRLRGIAFERL